MGWLDPEDEWDWIRRASDGVRDQLSSFMGMLNLRMRGHPAVSEAEFKAKAGRVANVLEILAKKLREYATGERVPELRETRRHRY